MNSRLAGFTLIEVLVVAGITALISGFLVFKFSRTTAGVDQATAVVSSEIRNTQTQAVAGVKFQSKHRCGYGLTPISATDGTGFRVYTGPDASSQTNPDCSLQNRNFEGADVIVRTITLSDPKTEIKNLGLPYKFQDIFFEPPTGTTYINNDGSPGAAPGRVTLGPQNVVCTADPASCRSICIYSSGRIETVVGVSCP